MIVGDVIVGPADRDALVEIIAAIERLRSCRMLPSPRNAIPICLAHRRSAPAVAADEIDASISDVLVSDVLPATVLIRAVTDSRSWTNDASSQP